MRHYDLMHPKTDEQEAANAAYIARECERIRATWTGRGVERRGIGEPVELREAYYLGIRARALEALRLRMERQLGDDGQGE